MSLLMKELETSSFLRGKYEVKSFRKEEIILNAEDRLDSIIILKSGKLKTYSLSENGAKYLMRSSFSILWTRDLSCVSAL